MELRDIALALALLLLTALAIRHVLRRLQARATQWSRTRRAQRGERRAEKLLRKSGYRILERQAPCTYELLVNGKPVEIEVRADLLVKNRRGIYVAEVKTGRAAPRIGNCATRRQLLEYAVAYDAIGVLLVDMEKKSIAEVRFPL